MSRAGILPPIEAVEVRDGRPVEGGSERPFRFTLDDIWLHANKRVSDVRGGDVMLLIEVADSSILRDLRLKASR